MGAIFFMRITSGSLKSRVIKDPRHIRPTQDKVRKGLFDTIRAAVPDSNFLDLYAGSGAVGIEALSNGAKEAVFVEKDNRCHKIIRDNMVQLGLMSKSESLRENASILSIDALRAIGVLSKSNKKFDIIFLDPPYYKDLAKKALQKLSACDILAPSGLVVAEHSKKDDLGNNFGDLTCFKQKRYGDTYLSFYSKSLQ
ncbi:16S rRNA (guanine(966)-N(2))-methyltransferase RsmD [Candidatus Omnitrophota bacterium]